MTPDTLSLRPLAWARIAFAGIFLARTTALIDVLEPSLGGQSRPLLGWPQPGEFHASVLGWHLEPGAVQVLCLVRTAGAVLLLLGYRPLVTGLATGIAAYLVMLQDAFSFTFTQHLLYVGAAVLGLSGSATTLSIRPEKPHAAATGRLLLWLFTTSVYLWAAIEKMRPDWLDGRTLALYQDDHKIRGPLSELLLATDTRRAIAATAVVVTELSLVPLLMVRRTRWVGLVVALGLHATIEIMATPDVLGWGMVALLLAFVPLEQEPPAQVAGSRSSPPLAV